MSLTNQNTRSEIVTVSQCIFLGLKRFLRTTTGRLGVYFAYILVPINLGKILICQNDILICSQNLSEYSTVIHGADSFG